MNNELYVDDNNILDLNTKYHLAIAFQKVNEGRAFHLSYQEKSRLSALIKQVCHGPLNSSLINDVGYLDVVGRDRINQWRILGDMSQTEAQKQYIDGLIKACPQFTAVLAAYSLNKEKISNFFIGLSPTTSLRAALSSSFISPSPSSLSPSSSQSEQQQQSFTNHLHSFDSTSQQQQSSLQAVNEKDLRHALRSYTHELFYNYAQNLFGEDNVKIEDLVESLHEEHYQAYTSMTKHIVTLPVEHLPMKKETRISRHKDNGEEKEEEYISKENNAVAGVEEKENETINCTNNLDDETIITLDFDYETKQFSFGDDILTFDVPQMWIRESSETFRSECRKDFDNVLYLGSGEVITLRVPTQDDSTTVLWQFATENYDIGFGLFFEFLHKSGDTSEEISILPVSRYDSHIHSFNGSHVFPCHGTYLLRFDNSYSLWRSKYLFYRIQYAK